MKEVVRYKCEYCDKLAAKPETILKHEAVCIKNPEGKNCYMCEMAYMGDYEYDDGYRGGTVKDQCMCAYYEGRCERCSRRRGRKLRSEMLHVPSGGRWILVQALRRGEKNLEKYMEE